MLYFKYCIHKINEINNTSKINKIGKERINNKGRKLEKSVGVLANWTK